MLFLLLVVKLDAFLSILITTFAVGLFNGMNIIDILDSLLNGIGNTMGKIILILAFGTMLGKLIEESGAAHTIIYRLVEIFGLKNIQYVILATGFLVGLPMMYNASFLVLIPFIYTLSSTTKLPLIYLGIPLSATLSIAHAYLPPHPAPTYVSLIYGANINSVLLIGLIPVIPACLIAGILHSKFFKNLNAKPPIGLHEEKHFEKSELPGLGISIFTMLTPVLLMLAGAIVDLFCGIPPLKAELIKQGISLTDFYIKLFTANGYSVCTASFMAKLVLVTKFFSDANIALMMAVLLGIYNLGIRQGKKISEIVKLLNKSVNAIAMIILIISAGGGFSQILRDSQVSTYIAEIAKYINFNPLILSFSVAAIMRLAIGSATVATMTAAPIMLPVAIQTGTSPELMVLATGSGSLMFSHFNDVGFWMFKEYYNVSVRQTFAIWTVMECLVAFVGLTTAILLDMFM